MSYKRISPQPIVEGGTGAQTFTSNGVLLGNGTSAISATTAGTTGQVLTGVTSGAPTFQSPAASSITITGDSGGGLTGNNFTFTGSTTGLTFAGAGSTETLGGTLIVANGGTGRATLTNHSVLIGAGTTAITQSAVGATGTVLIGNSAADPTFSATPTVTSITLGSGSALSTFVDWTSWTPTLTGATTAGTTTYTNQVGYYTRIGNIVFIHYVLSITAATGTGNLTIGGLPFTASSSSLSGTIGAVRVEGASYTYPVGATYCVSNVQVNTTNMIILGDGSTTGGAILQMQNTALNIIGSCFYHV